MIANGHCSLYNNLNTGVFFRQNIMTCSGNYEKYLLTSRILCKTYGEFQSDTPDLQIVLAQSVSVSSNVSCLFTHQVYSEIKPIRSNVTYQPECVRKTCHPLFVEISVLYFNYRVKVLSKHGTF